MIHSPRTEAPAPIGIFRTGASAAVLPRSMEDIIDNSSPKNWDLIVKVVGLIALMASGFWTLYKFRDDRRVDLEHRHDADVKDDKAREQEFNKYVFERQTDLYFEAARTAASIASSENRESVKKATDRFYELYWGELVVVEDRRVELAMIAFNECLDIGGKDCHRSIPKDQDEKTSQKIFSQLGPPALKNLSLELAACLRSALTHDRQIDFGKLSDPHTVCPYE